MTPDSVNSSDSFVHADIFAGCGGISLGLYNSGWKGLFAVEKDKMAFETLQHNLVKKVEHFDWPTWLPQQEHNIYTFLKRYKGNLKKLEGKIDLVAGGPPCQGFSHAGKRDGKDKRNRLVYAYTQFISYVQPRLLFFENVKGITSNFENVEGKTRTRVYSEYIKKKLKDLGYEPWGEMIDFSKFGVPQNRKRFILVAVKDGDPKTFFEKMNKKKSAFLERKDLKSEATMRDAISDLERAHGEIDSPEFKHFKEGLYGPTRGKYQKWMRKGYDKERPDSHRFARHYPQTEDRFNWILENCPRNRTISDEVKEKFSLRKRCVIPLDGEKPCLTLTTLPDDYIHYSEPRILTVREYARVQSFNDGYEIKGKYTTGGERRVMEAPRYTQIGNAVPPLFMELAGDVLKTF
jgi:DNA (cytosine-5)-methyltransferase 1